MQRKEKYILYQKNSTQEKLKLHTWRWLFNYIYCKKCDLKKKCEIILTSFQVDATLLQ